MDIDLMTMLKFFGIKLLVSRDKQIQVYRIKKMKCKEEYVNEISRFSNRF